MRSCVFDLDYSLYCLTLMRGGAHYALGDPGSPAIQILGTLETEEDQIWAALQLELILTGEGLAPDPEERRDILSTVRHMADPDVPVPMRTLSLARTPAAAHTASRSDSTPFCQGGEYAFCDGNADTLAWDKRLLCFEMAALKAMPARTRAGAGLVLSPTGNALVHRAIPCASLSMRPAGCSAFGAMFGQMEQWLKTRAKLKVRAVALDAGNGRPAHHGHLAGGGGARCPFASCCPMRRP